jgi:hypothetical protein
MQPGQALDQHGLLLEVLESSRIARELLDTVSERQGQMEGSIANTVINHLRAGETFHVAETVGQLVSTREAHLRATSTFGEYTPPTPCGVLVLDQPIGVGEVGDLSVISHMVTWGPTRFREKGSGAQVHGTIVVLWHDSRRVGARLELAAALGGDETLGLDPEEWALVVGETAGLLPVVVMALTSHVRLGPSLISSPVRGRAESVRSPLRILCALWQLMDETITVVEDAPRFGGAHKRRAERRGHRPRVTVVTLRRTSGKGVEGARGPLSERHDVRGHWRKYWVGSGDDRHQERRWVNMHESPNNPHLPKASHTRKVYDLRR